MFRRSRKRHKHLIDPDEIFFDKANVSNLNTQQFEGVTEKPINKKTLVITLGLFVLILFGFSIKTFNLQVSRGDEYRKLSEANRLNTDPIFAERGVIYDRNGIELAWNSTNEEKPADFLYRQYTDLPGIGHVLGYVNYPKKDSSGNYWRRDISGQAGLESKYNDVLSGINGARLYEVDALGRELSSNRVSESVNGKNLHTTIDARLQTALYKGIEEQANNAGFNAGAGAIMDIKTGELLSFTSYPEFDPYTLAEGEDSVAINSFFNDPRKPFLNRLTKGLYSPGSIVKPFLGLAALEEGIITPNTNIRSTGSIIIPNPFTPSQPSIFRDWRPEGHGTSDLGFAIADSVNTFFYAIGGGYKDQSGLGIERMEEYLRAFSIAEPTGIDFGTEVSGTIPNPEWKKQVFSDGAWRLGDTYNTAIGQFGFQVSPIQMLRSVAAIGTEGVLVTPKLLEEIPVETTSVEKNITSENYKTVLNGMRQTVTEGTARNINLDTVEIAAKTGTAQVGVNNEYFNSWIVGLFPYGDPQYSFVIVMERAPRGAIGSASAAMRIFLDETGKEYNEFWNTLK